MNLPNKITLSRICLIPLVLFFFLADFIPYGKLVAALIFGIAAITDNIDGRIARKRNLVTDLGKFLDPIADKVLVMCGLLLIIAYPISGLGPIVRPEWLGILCGILILARELIISAFRQIAATKNLVMAADKAGKIKAFLQDIVIFLYMIYAFMVADLGAGAWGTANTIIAIVLLVALVVTTVITIVSGIMYIVKNFFVLKDAPKENKKFPIAEVLGEFIESGVISANLISSKFGMEESEADKILEKMIEEGYVSDDEGDEKEVLMTQTEYEEIFSN